MCHYKNICYKFLVDNHYQLREECSCPSFQEFLFLNCDYMLNFIIFSAANKIIM